MSEKTGGAGGGGKQDARKKGKVKGGGRNREQERRVTGTRHEPSVRTDESSHEEPLTSGADDSDANSTYST
jgi:hypothetical protein